jgi:sugar lactone lactonase YvrE
LPPERLTGAEPIFGIACDVGESPFVDPRTGRLCWVDVTRGRVFHGDLEAGEHAEIALPDDVGALVPRRRGGWVAACGRGLVAVDDPDDGDAVVEDLGIAVEPAAGLRLNDATAAPDGSLWVGSMAYDSTPAAASLYRVSPRGDVHSVLTGLTQSNGLEFSADGASLAFVDSLAGGLHVLEVDEREVRTRRRIADVPRAEGVMDGLCLDTEGGIWTAIFGAGEVRRYDVAGECTHVVPLPVTQPTACCFNGNDLIISTAAYRLDQDALTQQPLAGRLFRIATLFAGLRPREFAG